MAKIDLLNYVDEKELVNLVSLYKSTKTIVALAEKLNSNNFVIPCTNEMRHALDHIMRVGLFYFGQIDLKKIGNISEREYIQYNISKATGHLYRCCSDAYEVSCNCYEDFIKDLIKEYRPSILEKAVPGFYRKYYCQYSKLLELSAKAKINKEVESKINYIDDEHNVDTKAAESIFFEWNNCIKQYEELKDDIIPNIEFINKFSLEEKQKSKKELIIKIAISLSSGIIFFLLGHFVWK